jgi:hypothetical protein
MKKILFSLILSLLLLSSCITTNPNGALPTASNSQIISVEQSNQKVLAAQKELETKFGNERVSYEARITNLEYTLSCLHSDNSAGLIAFKSKYSLLEGKVFEIQQKRLNIFGKDKETTDMWDLMFQAFNSGNIEGVNQIAEKVLDKADATATENGKLKTALETAQKETDKTIIDAKAAQELLTGQLTNLKAELAENLKQNEITLQNVIKEANDKNLREQQKWLNFAAGAFLLVAFLLIALKLWLKMDLGKWALLSGIFSPFCFWLSQIVGKSWFVWGFGGAISLAILIAVLIMIYDGKKNKEAKEKIEELDVIKSMAQKIVVQIKACDDDTKTKIADIIADDKDMTVSDLTSKFILDKLQMTKEEIAQVNFTKGEAKLAVKDSSK